MEILIKNYKSTSVGGFTTFYKQDLINNFMWQINSVKGRHNIKKMHQRGHEDSGYGMTILCAMVFMMYACTAMLLIWLCMVPKNFEKMKKRW